MPGIALDVELDDAEARARLAALVERMDRPQGFYRNVGEHMVASTADNFEAETDPDGIPWQQLMPRTIRERERRKQVPIKILRASGVLAGSINYRASDDAVTIGSAAPYAAAHQLGAEIEKPARPAKVYRQRSKDGKLKQGFAKIKVATDIADVSIPAHTITIPARRYLGVSKDDERIIIEIAEEWLAGE